MQHILSNRQLQTPANGSDKGDHPPITPIKAAHKEFEPRGPWWSSGGWRDSVRSSVAWCLEHTQLGTCVGTSIYHSVDAKKIDGWYNVIQWWCVYFSHNGDVFQWPFGEHQLQEEFSKGKEWRLYEYVTRCLVALVMGPKLNCYSEPPPKTNIEPEHPVFPWKESPSSGEDYEVLY